MKPRLEILPQALGDIVDARHWYEDQRPGLGIEFERTIEAALVGIERFPKLYPQVVGDIWRCFLGRFPYGIFYEVPSEDSILIVAVFHASRDPGSWAERF
ncbi:MAG: type II toxin-antitoxin system RelE/ParE family toxin [Phycisphaerales bacterium]|nr:type II toxin-antitoxin system RelE/ParE family toxin [Phycisphaerales bacterium]